jgi:deazaflavin-dependent oxidoreductase (nitroreductase family)
LGELQADASAQEVDDHGELVTGVAGQFPPAGACDRRIDAVQEHDRGRGQRHYRAPAIAFVDAAAEISGGDEPLDRGAGRRGAQRGRGGERPGGHRTGLEDQAEDAQVGAVDAEQRRGGGVHGVGGRTEVGGGLGGLVADAVRRLGHLLRHSKESTIEALLRSSKGYAVAEQTGEHGSVSEPTGSLPGWLPFMNRIIRGLSRLGLSMGPVRVLTVAGRRSGAPRSTPVSPLTLDGRRYVVAGLPDSDWARNVRAAGRGELAAGRRRTAVTLTEVMEPEQRRAVMRAFPTEVPGGVMFFVRLGLVTKADPDEFAAAADRVAVFQIDAPTTRE